MTTNNRKLPVRLLVLSAVILTLLGGMMYYQVIGADLSNPRANFWRVVRQGVPAYTSTPAQGHTILIQNSGENWREIRNGLLIRISPWLIILALAGMAAFHLTVGKDKLKKPRTGVKIARFTLVERIVHWYTAVLFIAMAITGLSLLLGRILLIPLFGHAFVSGYLQVSKVLHNYCGPMLLIGFISEFILWARLNIPHKSDLAWFKNSGMISHGPRAHTGKVNAGEKGWFWLIILFGTAVGITGILLDFPIWNQSRLTMQIYQVINSIVAILFVTVSLGHIYQGTIGVEGVFEGMWTGYIDAEWAQEQHDLWYEEKMREAGEKPGMLLPVED